jgi:hypothetical protein
MKMPHQTKRKIIILSNLQETLKYTALSILIFFRKTNFVMFQRILAQLSIPNLHEVFAGKAVILWTVRRLQKPNQVTIKGCPSISGVVNCNFPSTSKNKEKQENIP